MKTSSMLALAFYGFHVSYFSPTVEESQRRGRLI